MKEFVEKYKDRIHGVLSCFDHMLFCGYLPIMSGWQMAQFFNSSGIRFRELKPFLVQNAERVKRHAMIIAEQEGRPFQYLQEKIKKEDLARQALRFRKRLHVAWSWRSARAHRSRASAEDEAIELALTISP